jgi:hypothetical protein
MKKLNLILFLVVFTAGATAQQSLEGPSAEELEQVQQEINSQTTQVPDFLGSLLGDQTINVKIESNQTAVSIGVVTNGTAINDIQPERYDNATFEVNTSTRQIANITASEDPLQTLNNRFKNGEIDYRAEGTVNSIRVFIAEQLLTVASTLSSQVG